MRVISAVLFLAVALSAEWLYYLPYGTTPPPGVKYRVLAENGTADMVIQADAECPDLQAHPPTWANGQPVIDAGTLAEWRDAAIDIGPDTALALRAVIARSVLSVSPKLKNNEQLQYQLGVLEEAVKYTARSNATLTDVAVKAIDDIIKHPAIKAQPGLWTAIEQARQNVVNLTNGNIDP
jgi:hypothetical protein